MSQNVQLFFQKNYINSLVNSFFIKYKTSKKKKTQNLDMKLKQNKNPKLLIFLVFKKKV